MNDSEKLVALQEKISYHFKKISLLEQALTHSSYANERRINRVSDNERLEFLGDAVLELVSSEFIFASHEEMSEGEMSKLRASLVCEQALSFCAREIKLGEYLLLGKGEAATGGAQRDSILSDAMEAVIGAVYLDGGFTSAKEMILHYILNDIENKKLFYDSKTILQEMVQGKGKGKIVYELLSESGPDHNKTFVVQAVVNDSLMTNGTGKSKKTAEQAAAYQAIMKLRNGEDNACT